MSTKGKWTSREVDTAMQTSTFMLEAINDSGLHQRTRLDFWGDPRDPGMYSTNTHWLERQTTMAGAGTESMAPVEKGSRHGHRAKPKSYLYTPRGCGVVIVNSLRRSARNTLIN